MTDQTPSPSVSELAVVAGTTRAMARTAISAGAVLADTPTWIEALTLRVYATVSSMRFPGESLARGPDVAQGRAVMGAMSVRQAADLDQMEVGAQLVVTRDEVRLLPNLTAVYLYLDQERNGVEAAQVLPAGRWWYDMRWRMGTSAVSLGNTSPGDDPERTGQLRRSELG